MAEFGSWDQIKKNLSEFKLDYKTLWDITSAKKFDEKKAQTWTENHFFLTIQLSIAYVIVVFGTKSLMRNRQPFNLFIPLNVWNLFLAVFSIVGTIKLTPEFLDVVLGKGLTESYCHTTTFTSGINGYWMFLFILSKTVELVDTVFLVLRKRPLMFLHWYHHILTMIYAFYSYPVTPGFNRWGIYLNFFVHSFMYSYYFLRSMKIAVPGPVAKLITTLQIWQFIISVAILAHLGVLIYVQKAACDFNPRVFVLAVFMDVTYLILFINFFLKSYVLKGGKAKYKVQNGVNPKKTN
ncbi:unnamed protein product [Bursaphelenchus xylophilus]|uniref:Elongation of very long chain fatty acids protein n=1 Tax=Bursaphelenchus xylophilus TaxID=6326 RepID=A0A1I7S3B7_BURXY|nr:unnamed protein product [Bursaphelenchus xylophilus]CAG9116196.1 unnamed protein product [Bursaphelenchus xylophilus]